MDTLLSYILVLNNLSSHHYTKTMWRILSIQQFRGRVFKTIEDELSEEAISECMRYSSF